MAKEKEPKNVDKPEVIIPTEKLDLRNGGIVASPFLDGKPPMVLVRQHGWREPCSKCGGAQIYSHRIKDVGKESVDQYVCKKCGLGRIVVTVKTA